jgi:hypothetical protein
MGDILIDIVGAVIGSLMVFFTLAVIAIFLDWQNCRHKGRNWLKDGAVCGSWWTSESPEIFLLLAGITFFCGGVGFANLFMSKAILVTVGLVTICYATTLYFQKSRNGE